MPEKISEAGWEIPVLYEDNHLLVVVKPPNLPVQADRSGDVDLLTLAKRYIGIKFRKPGNVYLGLTHRLDRPVGGAMVFARTSKAAARLSAAFAGHAVDKKYLAVLQGALNSTRALEDWLKKDESTGNVSIVPENTPGAKCARLVTRPIAVRDGLTLTEVELMTGRAHQIRVQHLGAGFPLWGDARYGGGKPGQQIALWAYRLAFSHPVGGQPLNFIALPPKSGAWAAFYDIIETRGNAPI